jgi:uracil-DNA glycosylase
VTSRPRAALPHPSTGALFPSPVPPGTGWPGDPAAADTPVASDPADVVALAGAASTLADLMASMSVCRACPRLVAWREQVADQKRAAFAGQPYWGRPIVGWGAEAPRVLVVGLAPAAHGGNRTGRVFTGDRSGDWLFGSFYRVGLAVRPSSEHAADGQQLVGTRLVAAVRCAPPANAPTPAERDTCAPWLDAELGFVLPSVRVVVCLGLFGWTAIWRALGRRGLPVPRPAPRFGHGARVSVDLPSNAGGRDGGRQVIVLGCYHPSQQNTFTGKLTEEMLDRVLGAAAELAGHPVEPPENHL